MNLNEVFYFNVETRFGHSGPYIGKLKFLNEVLENEYLVDGEKISEERDKIVFSKFLGINKYGIFNLDSKREFKILVYDEKKDCFFQSKDTFEALCIEKMENGKIIFHLAFHTESVDFRRTIDFHLQNFFKLEKNPFEFEYYITTGYGDEFDKPNKQTIEKLFSDLQSMDDEHGAFWIVDYKENLLQVSKNGILHYMYLGVFDKKNYINNIPISKIKELFILFTKNKISEIKKIINSYTLTD